MDDVSGKLRHLGSQLQQLRRRKELTLGELAQLSDVSAGLLSQLERGMGNPSFHTLSKLAYGLGVPIGLFFQGTYHSDPVVRKNNRKKLVLEDHNLVYELLTPDLQRCLEFVWVEFAPGISTEQRPFCHEGEECGLVLQGTLEVHWGDEIYLLEAGDSVSYPCNIPHWYRNPGKEKAVSVWAITPPSF